jgi:ribose 5-phosphate isomerase B
MIALASDHAGFAYKQKVKEYLASHHLDFQDFGSFTPDPADYPDSAHQASESITARVCDRGIFICGSGIGMSIVANKHRGIRAAVCESTTSAELGRRHNNINVLCFGERLTTWITAQQMIDIFLNTKFDGGRHEIRVEKIHTLTSL